MKKLATLEEVKPDGSIFYSWLKQLEGKEIEIWLAGIKSSSFEGRLLYVDQNVVVIVEPRNKDKGNIVPTASVIEVEYKIEDIKIGNHVKIEEIEED